MEPLFPDDSKAELASLAEELMRRASALSDAMHPETRSAIAGLLRPMNSYYSNLIEGHDTHPISIEKVLKDEYEGDKKKRDLQLEALAHIRVHESLKSMLEEDAETSPSSTHFILKLHKRFYEHLPSDFLTVKTAEGKEKTVIPGTLRVDEVEVGRHRGPAHDTLNGFMERFSRFYEGYWSRSNGLDRIISIAAAHHRLVWIHPFLDGNGRVVRLFSDACFLKAGLDASGLWSISRGLARSRDTYRAMLANADMPRMGDLDGRGNLSDKHLGGFCRFFLQTAIDQISFMHKSLQIDGILKRIGAYVDKESARGALKSESRYLLEDLFLRGSVWKKDAERLLGLSDKPAKEITDELEKRGLLRSEKEGVRVRYHVCYPISFSPWLLPGLYPSGREAQMMTT